jgi:hypothetical protein
LRRYETVRATASISDETSHRFIHSHRYGFPLYRAPRAEDGQLVPAGLLARGSGVLSSLPDCLSETVSGVIGVNLPLTVAGAAAELTTSHRIPSSPEQLAPLGTVTGAMHHLISIVSMTVVRPTPGMMCLFVREAFLQRRDIGGCRFDADG